MDHSTPNAIPEIIRLARQLERQLGRRRKLLAELGKLDAEVKATRKLLSDLATPFDPGSVVSRIIAETCCMARAESSTAPHDPDCEHA